MTFRILQRRTQRANTALHTGTVCALRPGQIAPDEKLFFPYKGLSVAAAGQLSERTGIPVSIVEVTAIWGRSGRIVNQMPPARVESINQRNCGAQ
jgi:hypothetical protein